MTLPRVLIADDDADILTLVRIRLERAGFEVVAANDGEEAWRAVQNGIAPDLAVLDVAMPRMDGLELTALMRQHPSTAEIPILILTAAVQDSVAERALEAGATATMKKPFSPRELIDRVTVLVEAEHARQAAGGGFVTEPGE